MVAAYSIKDSTYYVHKCTADDIAKHYDEVASLVADTDKEVYVDNMQRSIQNDSAYLIKKDDKCVGFMYLYIENGKWYGASIHGTDILGFIVLMVEITKLYGYINIKFIPHTNTIHMYKSMLTGSSIRMFRSGSKYVTLRTSLLMDKIHKVYALLGVVK